MKILITGGCGFLGSNLANHALQQRDELAVFDNLCRDGAVSNLQWLRKQGSFLYVHGDIRNQNDVTRIVMDFRPDAIFHLAGQVAMTTSIEDPRSDFEVNVLGSLNILESSKIYSPDAVIVYSSSNKVYGDLESYRYSETETRYKCIDKPEGFDETTPLEFHSPYGCSKGAADQYMLDYARIFGLKTVVFRHSSMYGGRQYASYDQGWIGWFCKKAVEIRDGILKEPFMISGSGKQVRDVLHADDIIQLYFSALNKGEKIRGSVFNIGGGMRNSLSLLELFHNLETLMKVRMNYIKLPVRISDQKVFVADIRKAQTQLDWAPLVDKNIGIKRMLDWIIDAK
jgi:CDP-paratose 2-epimerase